jgi:peptidoglycan/LPS O-acetylase OafA/YrhL
MQKTTHPDSEVAVLLPTPSQAASSPSTKLYFPNLDGLRFFCFLAVFLFHAFSADSDALKSQPIWTFVKTDLFGNGNLGVSFFFVLSGYLITTLLLAEKELAGRIDVPHFYLRRVLRIWPLFYACVVFGFLVFPFLKKMLGQAPAEEANPIYFLFFINNFDMLRVNPDSSVLGVLWSVAIEEQFYLFWPLIIAFVPRRGLPFVFAIIIGGSMLFRALHVDNHKWLEHHTLSCIGDMAVGGVAALLTQYAHSPVRRWLSTIGRPTLWALYAAVVVLFLFRDELFASHAVLPLSRLVCAIVFALVILEQNFAERSLFKMSNFRRISRLGQFTYGLYCLHFIGLLISMVVLKKLHLNTSLWHELLLDPVLALALSFGVAWMSYRFYEMPFLKLKDRFAIITKGGK